MRRCRIELIDCADRFIANITRCNEAAYSPAKFHGRVIRIPLGDDDAPPLSSIQAFCQQVDQWLSLNPQKCRCRALPRRTSTFLFYFIFSVVNYTN